MACGLMAALQEAVWRVGRRRVQMKKKRAGTAARPRERRHPTLGSRKDAPVHHQTSRRQTEHKQVLASPLKVIVAGAGLPTVIGAVGNHDAQGSWTSRSTC